MSTNYTPGDKFRSAKFAYMLRAMFQVWFRLWILGLIAFFLFWAAVGAFAQSSRYADQLPLAQTIRSNDTFLVTTNGPGGKGTRNVEATNVLESLKALPNWPTETLSTTSKVLVIEGSSTAQGVGASSYPVSVCGKLTTYLQGQGWTVYNQAVGGNVMSDAVKRFYSSTLKHKPQILLDIMAANDIAFGNSFNEYMNNKQLLRDLCWQNGITYMTCKIWPRNEFTPTQNDLMARHNAEIETWGCPIIDLYSAVVDRDAVNKPLLTWFAGYTADGLHPNDAGHDALYKSIPLALFDNWDKWRKCDQSLKRITTDGMMIKDTAGGNVAPFKYTSSTAMHSYTYSFWFKQVQQEPGGPNMVSLACISPTLNGNFSKMTLVANLGANAQNYPVGSSYFNWNSDGFNKGSMNPYPGKFQGNDWHNIVMVYCAAKGTSYTFYDGMFWDTASDTLTGIPVFSLGGRDGGGAAATVNFKDVAVWRVALSAEQIKDVYNRVIPMAGLEVFSPFDDQSYTAGTKAKNYAPNTEGFLPGWGANNTSFVRTDFHRGGITGNFVAGSVTLYITNGIVMKVQ